MIQQFEDLNLSTVRVHKSGLNAKQMNFYLIYYVCKFTKIQRFIYLQHVTIVLSEDLRRQRTLNPSYMILTTQSAMYIYSYPQI